jgi:hypothetical protein
MADFYHNSAPDALRFRLRHIEGGCAIAQGLAGRLGGPVRNCPAPALDNARRDRL